MNGNKFMYAFLPILFLAIILVVGFIFCVDDIRNDLKVKKITKECINDIKKRGYKWLTEPFAQMKVYISARKENVKRIGIYPDGKILYETYSGKHFLWKEDNIQSVIIDVADRVHIHETPDGLVIESSDLIIPKDYYVILDKQEAQDFLIYNTNSEYNYDTFIVDESVKDDAKHDRTEKK